MKLDNPFEYYPPEVLTSKDVYKLFIRDYTEHNMLTSFKHILVEGARGSGKSMLFKYLEPACQRLVYGGWQKFMSQPKPFISIYINCNTGDFRLEEYSVILKSYENTPIGLYAKKLITHEFIMRIVECTLKTITNQFKLSKTRKERELEICTEIIDALDKKNLYSDKEKYPRNLQGIREIAGYERDKVRESVEEFLLGIQSSPGKSQTIKYNGNLIEPDLSQGKFLNIFFTNLRSFIQSKKAPFFLLFDEAGSKMLLTFQQKIINSFVTQRYQDLVCVKVSMRPKSYCLEDINGKSIQHIHDYDSLILDSLYTNNTQAYYKRIIDIANKRMLLADFKVTDIQQFLPESESEIQKMNEAKKYTADEYDRLPVNGRPENKNDYVNKYAKARFFQYFVDRNYGYTGFENLVHFSAGIARVFLTACFRMTEKYRATHQDSSCDSLEKLDFIPYQIQSETIKAFSNELIEKELKERISVGGTTSREREELTKLLHLIESMGQAFNYRLHNKKSRYPRIISFSIKDSSEIKEDLIEILHLGLREAFLQERSYRGKSGYEMLNCYILNRALCPRFRLDLSGFQGRIEISKDDLYLAMESPSRFISLFKSKERTGQPEEEIQLGFFGV